MFDIDIIKESSVWEEVKIINNDFINNILNSVIHEIHILQKFKKLECSLLLTNDNKLQQLNSDFMGKNKPTNVLSFPDREILPSDLINIKEEEIFLGDIAISYERVIEESEKYNIDFENHFTHLLVHGILHLIGYDHESDDEWDEMIEAEIKILTRLNIDKPPIYVWSLE